jgi:hypothetical protein
MSIRPRRPLVRMLLEDRHSAESRLAGRLPLLRRLHLDLLDELGEPLLPLFRRKVLPAGQRREHHRLPRREAVPLKLLDFRSPISQRSSASLLFHTSSKSLLTATTSNRCRSTSSHGTLTWSRCRLTSFCSKPATNRCKLTALRCQPTATRCQSTSSCGKPTPSRGKLASTRCQLTSPGCKPAAPRCQSTSTRCKPAAPRR